ncbi:alpha/beta fold hydrolase [Nonomuraea polychroma]|uniref:alpha/beta fold hydrolase n=1 Tax=Nonomuraea polychroma TaxID=46176 RepID=UPI003D8DDA3E
MQPSPAEIAVVAGDDLRLIVFDRRGRGESGDTEPYAVQREIEDIAALIAEGRQEEALKLFTVEAVGIPEEWLGGMTTMPTWEPAIQVAPTLRYDGRIMEGLMAGDPAALQRYADVTTPVLVLVGEQTFPSLPPAAAAIADVLPKGELRQIPTADHTLTAEAVVPVLREFVAGH